MGGGGGTRTVVNKTELPDWVEDASEANYGEASQIADNRNYQQYNGNRVAGMSSGEQSAMGLSQQAVNASGSMFNRAANAAADTSNYSPQQVQAQTLLNSSNGSVEDYMNPNLDNVANTTMQGMERQQAQGGQDIADNARSAGAFGSSRQALQQAVFDAESDKAQAQTEAQLRSNAYNDAASRLQSDNASSLQAAQANQGAGLNGARLRSSAAGTLSNIGSGISDVYGRQAVLQNQIGQQQRSINQAELDTAYQDFMDKNNMDVENLNLKMAALGMSPYGQTNTQTTTQSGGGSGAMQAIGAGISALPFLFGSDRRVKKNVKRVGKVPGTDLNDYSYQYRTGFLGRRAPGMLPGLMADDVKRKRPDAVHTVTQPNGTKRQAVDYGKALEGADLSSWSENESRGGARPAGVGIGARAKVRTA